PDRGPSTVVGRGSTVQPPSPYPLPLGVAGGEETATLRASPADGRLGFGRALQEFSHPFDGFDQADALEVDAFGEAGEQAGGGGGVEHHEAALVVGAADQAPEGLGDAAAGDGVVVALAAEPGAAGLVQDVGPRPGD